MWKIVNLFVLKEFYFVLKFDKNILVNFIIFERFAQFVGFLNEI